jgi:hypothetical protein
MKWLKIAICIVSFGMIFPNVLTEGMENTKLPPIVGEADDEKKR